MNTILALTCTAIVGLFALASVAVNWRGNNDEP